MPETVRIKHRAFLSYSHAAPEVAAADGRGDDPRRHEAIVGSGADAEVCCGSAMATSRLMLATARQKAFLEEFRLAAGAKNPGNCLWLQTL